ncbi:MAG: PIN domain-containing protein [Terriglobia bacterium]
MRLAADANVLLSAVLGGRARLILESPQVEEILTVEQTVAEVHEYAIHLAKRKGLSEDLVLLAVGALPVTIAEQTTYKAAIAEASKRIGKRDPDDVELLALAIALSLPVWSNDRDFKGTGIEWLTTEALLNRLGLIGES